MILWVSGEVSLSSLTLLIPTQGWICVAPWQVVTLADYDHVEEVTKEGVKKSPSPGYPLVCVTPCDPHFPKYAVMKERCNEAGINQTSVQFSWEVAAPTDGNGARSPFETITDNTPFTSVNHMVGLVTEGETWPFSLLLQLVKFLKVPACRLV